MGRSQSLPRGDDPRFGPDADDSGSPILHVDMDAFFAAVEVRRRPELRGRPVIVGGVGPRGVVSSASYEARRYGVRSAMPTSQARARCPHAVYLPPEFTAYTAASRAVMQIFRDVTPLVEPLSLDEAFLDVSGARRLFGSPAAIARLIRRGSPTSRGSPVRSGWRRASSWPSSAPPGPSRTACWWCPPGQVLDFLHPLPVDALWGVGERAAESLRRLGLATVGDLAEAPLGMLRKAVGAAVGGPPARAGLGTGPAPGQPRARRQVDRRRGDLRRRRGRPAGDPPRVARAQRKVGVRLRGSGQVGRTVALKVRLADFRTVSRSRTLDVPTDTAREMFDTVWALYTALDPGERIRLVGVRVEGLAAGAGRAPAAHPRRARARLARGGSCRGRRRCPVRAVRHRSGQSDGRP